MTSPRKFSEAAFEVSKELGSGFLESVYKNAMVIVLRAKGLKVETEKPILVMFRGQQVGQFYADLFVDGKVIVELKAVSALAPEHSAQTINYLKATGIDRWFAHQFWTSKNRIQKDSTNDQYRQTPGTQI